MSSEVRVAFLGLGGMGRAIASNILKKGFKLVVWNRTTSKANELVTAGAHLAGTPCEAVADADVIVSCLFDDKSCLSVAQGENGFLNGIRQGVVHVNITTISPMAAIQIQKLHEQHGAHYVAGPVLGRPDMAAAGQLHSILGGPHEAVERARSVVQSYSGGSIVVVGENPVHANVLKLSANMGIATTIALFGQVHALNERWGVDPEITRQTLGVLFSHPSEKAYEERVRNRNYSKLDGEGFGLDGGLKDLELMLSTGAHVGVPLPFCSVMEQYCISAIGHGFKDQDWSVLADVARLNAGLPLPPLASKK